jgi:hypothetical protein
MPGREELIMELTLNDRELAILRRVLKQYLPDMRMTISDTENYEWRQSMKEDEAVLKELIARLDAMAPAGTTTFAP